MKLVIVNNSRGWYEEGVILENNLPHMIKEDFYSDGVIIYFPARNTIELGFWGEFSETPCSYITQHRVRLV